MSHCLGLCRIWLKEIFCRPTFLQKEKVKYFTISRASMNKLIITAHPNPNGFTHHIGARFSEVARKNHHHIKTIDLYQDVQQGFLQLNESNRPIQDDKQEQLQKNIQDQISWADELVFVFPLRWMDCPAIMKNFLDINLSHGFAFKYRSGKLQPEKLLKGKHARVFITAGGPNRFYRSFGSCIRLLRSIGRLGYVGIKLRSWVVFGSMNKLRSPEDREKMLTKVERIANSS